MRSDYEICDEGLRILLDKMDVVEAERFITLIKQDKFDYTEWRMPEEIICEYERAMNEIIVDEKIYDYLYIFSYKHDFPLLNPIPYSREKSAEIHDKNYILREEEIGARIKEFNEKAIV